MQAQDFRHPTAGICTSVHSQYFNDQDFLSWTRTHEWQIDAEFHFSLANGTRVDVWNSGVICFSPSEESEEPLDLILSSGVHGNETAPIEICADLVERLLAEEIQATQRVLFLFANPASMNVADRFVEENMNRLFSGAHAEDGITNKERKRAAQMEEYVERFYTNSPNLQTHRVHYDLHTAIRESKNEKFAVYPFRHGQPWKLDEIKMLGACGVKTILLSHAPTTTFSYFSSNNFGADAFTVELGQVKAFGENDMTRFVEVAATLESMIVGRRVNTDSLGVDNFDVYQVNRAINRMHEAFELHFADDVPNFTDFPLGFVLATDNGVEHKVEVEGEAIIFPNAEVAIGQRALLTVTPTTLDV